MFLHWKKKQVPNKLLFFENFSMKGAREKEEIYLMFLEEGEEVEDLEALKYICNACSLNLYIEDSRKGVNYMVSGNSFVLDIFYKKEESNLPPESLLISDNQSVEGSLIQSRDKVENIPHKNVDKVSLSLLEEKWEKFFRLFTHKVFHCLRRKKYLRIYQLLRKITLYDGEEAKENIMFGEAVKRAEEIQENMQNILENNGSAINYSVEKDIPCVLWKNEELPEHPICFAVEKKEFLLLEKRYSEEEMLSLVAHLRSSEILWKSVSEHKVFGISEALEVHREADYLDLHLDVGAAEDKRRIRITRKGAVQEKESINRYYTLLMKRGGSLLHLINVIHQENDQLRDG